MDELDVRTAQEQARTMRRYVEAFNGQKFTAFDDVDRQNLATALDNLLETAAMLGNVSDRLAALTSAPAEPIHRIPGLGFITDEDDGRVTLEFKDETAANQFMKNYGPSIDCDDMPARGAAQEPCPIDMVLHCPKCGLQHVDAPEELPMPMPGSMFEGSAGWTNPPHKSHLCHGCGHIWRPADVPTNGVQAVKTTGKADSPTAPAETPPAAGAALAVAEPPLLGRWHHGEGVLCSGSLRIARWDCDTNPPSEFRDKALDWVCNVLTAEVDRYKAAQPIEREDGPSSEWCSRCGCGNDQRGYAHLAGCPTQHLDDTPLETGEGDAR